MFDATHPCWVCTIALTAFFRLCRVETFAVAAQGILTRKIEFVRSWRESKQSAHSIKHIQREYIFALHVQTDHRQQYTKIA